MEQELIIIMEMFDKYYIFAEKSPCLAFFITGAAISSICTAFVMPFKFYFRHRNIKTAGWPPAHLDADGDFLSDDGDDD